ncbi:hypothetical protein GCM10007876_20920 [Litoribrevibacter albus]|uniref:Metallo-beta-lactamase domain-containing protein n=2 Tax=Litoribrevibacter albus TaxID=1473156 RepID=A0AA37SB05_9GAMM|nr:hypothetical protein GCM10007876_20920 [Litoribrevibacter albus]
MDVWFLDVGQALSIVLIKDHRAFIYDTGFSFGSFNAADSVIVPFLRSQNVEAVDVLVVSHQDLDHSGGMKALLSSSYVPSVLIQNFTTLDSYGGEQKPCDNSLSFKWQGVSVRALWPMVSTVGTKGNDLSSNDSSCVLLLEYQGHEVLLTGDITARVERTLIEANPDVFEDGVELISVPHHGSRTSSSDRFVKQVKSKWAVVSSGPLNRFRHPNLDVVNRYFNADIKLMNTADEGAVHFAVLSSGQLAYLPQSVEEKSPYWRTIRVRQ